MALTAITVLIIFSVTALASANIPPLLHNNAANVTSRIYGGIKGDLKVFPYFAYFGCGGALIDPLIVLTAAHCLYKRQRPRTVEVGPDRQKFEVAWIALHPEYGPGDDSKVPWAGARRDVALIGLKTPVTYVKPIHRYRDIPPVGAPNLYHMGRGENPLGAANKFYYGKFTTSYAPSGFVDYPEMIAAYGDIAPGGSEPSYVNRVTSCPGDSGGPLVWNNVIVGTGAAIFLEPCGSGWSWWPRAETYNAWIDTYIIKSGKNPPLYAHKYCGDQVLECISYAQAGYCTDPKEQEYMQKNCQLACGLCSTGSDSCTTYWYYTSRDTKLVGSLAGTKLTKNTKQCFKACHSNPKCNSFNWYANTKQCFMLKENGENLTTVYPSVGFRAGYIYCLE